MKTWIGLDGLLSKGGSTLPVGLGSGQTWLALAARREAWRQALQAAPAGPVALHMDDGFEFNGALLGAWAAGRTVILPADATPATAQALQAQGAVLLGSFPGAMARPADGPALAQAPRALPATPLVVFTSGSTGEPMAIPKARRCLDNELQSLEALFGAAAQGAVVIATVSQQHYYGLLFKSLWPLCAGRPALAAQLKLPEELAAACDAAGRSVLVSSPALLKRLAGSDAAVEALAPARQHLRAVFSSGGPLPWDAVLRSQAALGHAPFEVFGSSETGGVAWRQRSAEDQPWAPMPGVELAVEGDGALTLRSPHLADDAWASTADRVALVDGGFRLLGRSDRVAKVEEKRVSLTAMEQRLQAQPGVAEARVLLLPGQREELGAVLRLDPGAAPADEAARRELLKGLKAALAQAFEAVALPRRWRLVAELPVNSLGKVTQASLQALFDGLDDPRWPELLFVHRTAEGECQLELLPQAGLHWFKGHFPQVAILPGVVQVHWAVAYGAQHLGISGPFKGLQALKFNRPIFPGKRVTLGLKPRPDGRSFEFSYRSEEGRHSSGRVQLG